ncbi:hypothetical protein [Nonomuraea recticatena]|uniref:hypothetical protein n=1 Tax=Nonomuraea recticatena TaxID=46178 RepID=UPI003621A10D
MLHVLAPLLAGRSGELGRLSASSACRKAANSSPPAAIRCPVTSAPDSFCAAIALQTGQARQMYSPSGCSATASPHTSPS